MQEGSNFVCCLKKVASEGGVAEVSSGRSLYRARGSVASFSADCSIQQHVFYMG